MLTKSKIENHVWKIISVNFGKEKIIKSFLLQDFDSENVHMMNFKI